MILVMMLEGLRRTFRFILIEEIHAKTQSLLDQRPYPNLRLSEWKVRLAQKPERPFADE